VPTARDARDWVVNGGLDGLGNSLYTPFSGDDGDDIDWEAYRFLVRYCVGDLGHEMLWLTSGNSEWWSLTLTERKQLVEVAIEEARATAPDSVVGVACLGLSAKDTVELVQHAQDNGADICHVQTPVVEVHGGDGVLRFFQYVADRTDIALGMFNSPSSGYVLTPEECARIYHEIPAVCAIKEGVMQEYTRSKRLHALAPGLHIGERDHIVYQAGWLQQGIVAAGQTSSIAYVCETVQRPWFKQYWSLIWAGKLRDARTFAKEQGTIALLEEISWFTEYPGRPGFFTHWAEPIKYAASVIGLPVGDYPRARAPQALLPDDAKATIRSIYEKAGMAGSVSVGTPTG
jgi:4-hydroxy-tetrahydrodipicolinate synthase